MIYSYYLTHFHGSKGAHYKGVRALRVHYLYELGLMVKLSPSH